MSMSRSARHYTRGGGDHYHQEVDSAVSGSDMYGSYSGGYGGCCCGGGSDTSIPLLLAALAAATFFLFTAITMAGRRRKRRQFEEDEEGGVDYVADIIWIGQTSSDSFNDSSF